MPRPKPLVARKPGRPRLLRLSAPKVQEEASRPSVAVPVSLARYRTMKGTK